jgi:hypothetical protein
MMSRKSEEVLIEDDKKTDIKTDSEQDGRESEGLTQEGAMR